ncbi:hypothetical protein LZQ00_12330 [Sphingobacterium sp. SRCM116780]|uniref:hypothetical protein n=1 Tax=Sphingobacterium sp. SRCM116780 TaxID=2907623 RepID=UPI001F35B154|nr:hypothetical protein [Sphingobacterium sp. SRCM116780]UIR55066.1 hypothetical protein LZQ00_12330 [Sphingobacterium sp. SRCM116780]
MSTNNNNASQTLFRLAGLRSPQLTETRKENLGFIHRPDVEGIKGFFDAILEAGATTDGITKFTALEIASKDFTVPEDFKSDIKLENLYPALSSLGKSLCKREEITASAINKATAEWSAKTSGLNADETIAQQKILWDNMIYQTVTQHDFQVKEVIIQILKAIHYLDADSLERTEETIKINGEDFRAKAATAAIVFPDALVLRTTTENNGIPFTVNQSAVGGASIKYANSRTLSVSEQNQLTNMANIEVGVSESLLRKDALEVLKSELENARKEYTIAYNASYNTQYAAYQVSIQPEKDRYEGEVRAVEAGFTDQTTDAEKTAAYQNVIPVNIPPFEFIFNKEIDLTVLKNKLSGTSFAVFVELFTNYGEDLKMYISQNPAVEIDIQVISPTLAEINGFTLSLNAIYSTFEAVITKLNSGISENFSKASSLKVLPQRQFANIGGVLIPVAESAKVFPNSYYLRLTSENSLFVTNTGYLQFGFTTEDSSWSVSSIKISVGTGDLSQEETQYNIAVTDGSITIPPMLIERFEDIGSLSIHIWFDNGCESTLDYASLAVNTDMNGILNITKSSASGDTPSVFQPKHFGVKRLGIADYLKVEQSIHAYVPGEISNIENVMASELRHKSSTSREYSEITTSTSKSQETEKLSDTTKTSRADMQTEVARQLEKEQSYDAHTRFGKSGTWYFEAGGSYASNSAQQDSTRQAVAKSQEITERALESVLTKISEERVEKIIKEYTETNVHEYDNRGKVIGTNTPDTRPQHISGVYRWVDKKMKNQIFNYGKRMMFEFMIPEPARLHTLATKSVKATLTEPLDPRKANDLVALRSYSEVTEDKLKYWLKFYPELDLEFHPLTAVIPLTKSIEQWSNDGRESHAAEFDINLPENYKLDTIKGIVRVGEGKSQACFGNMWSDTYVAGQIIHTGGYRNDWPIDLNYIGGGEITGNIQVTNNSWDIGSINYSMVLSCSIVPAFLEMWKIKSFNLLVAAYEAAYEKFREAQSAINEQAAEQEKENNEKAAIFYRSTESNILKHNCIAYLLQNYNAIGLEMSVDDGQNMQSFNMKFGDNLDQYTALAKFMEQAFEWTVMDYTFYPYYWANKNHWQDLYMSEELNPLFRSFLQAGMARVIVTVKPGFEDAVQFFMNTGRIWNGGIVPVIGDPLYLSIVDEMREPTGVPQGKFWITRVPTTLTILQAKSAGLEVEDALPIFPEDNPENCENPKELETVSAFGAPVDAVMLSLPGTTSTLG